MAILQTLVASSALALAFLAAAPSPANALIANGNNHLARNHGISPAHEGIAKRKRNSHKNRKRCVAPPSSNPTSSATNPGYTPPADTTTTTPSTGGQGPGSNGGYGGNGKVGLGWAPDVDSRYIQNAVSSKVGYYYNWSPWPTGENTNGAKFVPMYWGDVQSNGWTKGEEFDRLIVNGGTNYGVAIGMNEVNEPSQALMDAGTGISQWRQHVLPLRYKGYRIGSPSTTNAPSGIQWMHDFYNGLGGNEYPDFNCLHWYGVGIDNFKGYVTDFHNNFPNQNIWITEFACTDFSYQQGCDVWAFTQQATDWLDSVDFVESYFMFGFVGDLHGVSEANRLIDPWSGSLTALGGLYIN